MSVLHPVKLLKNRSFLRAFIACALTGICASNAYTQNAGDMLNLFGGMMRGAIVQSAGAEWRKIPQPELACIEQQLRQQGQSTLAFIEQGIAPGDARLAGIRAGCAVSAAPPRTSVAIANPQPLSATPTFDCTTAKSGSGRILCADQAGGNADWEISGAYWANLFSLAEADRDAFKRGHDDWVQSVNRTCRLLPQQYTYAPQQRQCVLTAFRARADAYRSRLRGDALTESKLSPEQHADIQNALITLGLLVGEADGQFGPVTRSAIKRFQAQSGEPESEFLTATQRNQLLQAARARPREVQTAETPPSQAQSTITQSPGAGSEELERLKVEAAKRSEELEQLRADSANRDAEEQERRRVTEAEAAKRAADEQERQKIEVAKRAVEQLEKQRIAEASEEQERQRIAEESATLKHSDTAPAIIKQDIYDFGYNGIPNYKTVTVIQATVDSLYIKSIELNRGNCKAFIVTTTGSWVTKKDVEGSQIVGSFPNQSTEKKLFPSGTTVESNHLMMFINPGQNVFNFDNSFLRLKFGGTITINNAGCAVLEAGFDSNYGTWTASWH
jgi:peptidoglycan hydrolase-like protein with peptidoglycan-binding domain